MTKRFALVIAGGVLIVGGLMTFKILNDRHYAATSAGALHGAHLVHLADGRPAITVGEIVVVPHGRHGADRSDRLEVIDTDGVRLARVMVDHSTACVAAAPGLLWCDTSIVGRRDLELRDAATLAVRVPHAKLVAGAPALAAGQAPVIEAATGEAWMMTADGRFWHVDPRTLRGGVVDQRPASGTLDVGASQSPLDGGIRLEPNSIYFEGSPRATLTFNDNRGGTHPIAPDTFLHPQLLVDREGPAVAYPAALGFEDGKVLIVIHDDTVDHDTAHMQVTALGLDGKRRWTVALDHGEVRAAWIVGHRLVVGVHHGDELGSEIIALDEADGHVVWRAGT